MLYWSEMCDRGGSQRHCIPRIDQRGENREDRNNVHDTDHSLFRGDKFGKPLSRSMYCFPLNFFKEKINIFGFSMH